MKCFWRGLGRRPVSVPWRHEFALVEQTPSFDALDDDPEIGKDEDDCPDTEEQEQYSKEIADEGFPEDAYLIVEMRAWKGRGSAAAIDIGNDDTDDHRNAPKNGTDVAAIDHGRHGLLRSLYFVEGLGDIPYAVADQVDLAGVLAIHHEVDPVLRLRRARAFPVRSLEAVPGAVSRPDDSPFRIGSQHHAFHKSSPVNEPVLRGK